MWDDLLTRQQSSKKRKAIKELKTTKSSFDREQAWGGQRQVAESTESYWQQRHKQGQQNGLLF